MWSVYIVKCADDTYYTGISNDVNRRVANHNAGKGAKYTKTRGPVELITQVDGFTKSAAMKLEYKVKKQPRKNKISFLNARSDR